MAETQVRRRSAPSRFDVKVGVRMSSDHLEELERIAEQRQVSVSAVIRMMLAEHLPPVRANA